MDPHDAEPEPQPYVCIGYPYDARDVAVTHALMSCSGIPYFIEGENEGSAGLFFCTRRLLVPRSEVSRALKILRRENFLLAAEGDDAPLK